MATAPRAMRSKVGPPAERRVQVLQGSPLRLEVLRGDKKIAIEMKLE